MANMCSVHHPSIGPVAGCRACHSHPSDVFPGWDDKHDEAEAAGKHTCERCAFVGYLTVSSCPACRNPVPPELFSDAQERVRNVRARHYRRDAAIVAQAEFVEAWRAAHPTLIWGEVWICPLCARAIQTTALLADCHPYDVEAHQEMHKSAYRDYLAAGQGAEPGEAPS